MSAIIKPVGKVDYLTCWNEMKDYTESRDAASTDELWLVEHDPVFTLGLAGKEEHILIKTHDIPIVNTDRGGQVTYHGPQQIVIYLLIDIHRLNISVRDFVVKIENSIIKFLARYGVDAYGDRDAPGVYVAGKKIASLGLKIRKGRSYHGLSFNFNLDKKPFSYINPCGYVGLQVVNMAELVAPESLPSFADACRLLAEQINHELYS